MQDYDTDTLRAAVEEITEFPVVVTARTNDSGHVAGYDVRPATDDDAQHCARLGISTPATVAVHCAVIRLGYSYATTAMFVSFVSVLRSDAFRAVATDTGMQIGTAFYVAGYNDARGFRDVPSVDLRSNDAHNEYAQGFCAGMPGPDTFGNTLYDTVDTNDRYYPTDSYCYDDIPPACEVCDANGLDAADTHTPDTHTVPAVSYGMHRYDLDEIAAHGAGIASVYTDDACACPIGECTHDDSAYRPAQLGNRFALFSREEVSALVSALRHERDNNRGYLANAALFALLQELYDSPNF